MTGGGGVLNGGQSRDSRRYTPADNEGWNRVRSKQERRGGGGRRVNSVDVARGNMNHGGEISSFYFTSFPESWSACDMLHLFDKQDRVQEVVILARRNAQGNRFGFVRLFDVKEPDLLAIILDNIFIEGEKIRVNLPRFQREAKHVSLKKPVETGQVRKVPQVWVKKSDANSTVKEVDFVCDFNTWHLRFNAMVGEVITSGKPYYIQDELAQMGEFAIKATLMGSNLVLLEGDPEEGDFNDI